MTGIHECSASYITQQSAHAEKKDYEVAQHTHTHTHTPFATHADITTTTTTTTTTTQDMPWELANRSTEQADDNKEHVFGGCRRL